MIITSFKLTEVECLTEECTNRFMKVNPRHVYCRQCARDRQEAAIKRQAERVKARRLKKKVS